jgi:hypothetical protein
MLPDVISQLRVRPPVLFFGPDQLRIHRGHLACRLTAQESFNVRVSALAGVDLHGLARCRAGELSFSLRRQ